MTEAHSHLEESGGVTDPEFFETLSVGLIGGGSTVIPHLRRAVATLDELRRPDHSSAG